MKKFMKRTSIALTLLLASNSIAPLSVFASETTSVDKTTVISIEDDRAPQVSEVVIFLAGVVVGYIIDGTIIYATGHSAGEWVAIALKYYNDNPNVSSIHISSSGRVHGGGSTGF